jgi:hypothetical protein
MTPPYLVHARAPRHLPATGPAPSSFPALSPGIAEIPLDRLLEARQQALLRRPLGLDAPAQETHRAREAREHSLEAFMVHFMQVKLDEPLRVPQQRGSGARRPRCTNANQVKQRRMLLR